MTPTYILARVDKGGHRAYARWTRHVLDPQDNRRMLCGAHPTYPVADGPAQGEVRECQRCKRKEQA
jgi:hypothetical protein